MVYKIGFSADWHMGYASGKHKVDGINLRVLDGYSVLSTIRDEMITEEVDSIVVGGDVFHSPSPDFRSIGFVQDSLRMFARANIDCYLLTGNHDVTDRAQDYAASLLLNDTERNIFSHVEPYSKHEIAPNIWLHMISHHFYTGQEETLKNVIPIKGAVNILTTHGSTIDPLLDLVLQTNASPREIVIPQSVMERGWDAVLLGHIHERQFIKGLPSLVVYNGSLIRRGFSDGVTELGRGWLLVTVDDEGKISIETREVAQRPQIDLPTLDASNMLASELTEAMVSNLQLTQIEGVSEFDAHIAPIVRQSIINLSSSQKMAIDKKAIFENSLHAFQYDRKETMVDTMKTKDEKTDGEHLVNTGDINDTFKEWSQNSQVLQATPSSIREDVLRQSQDFMKQGHYAVLDKDS